MLYPEDIIEVASSLGIGALSPQEVEYILECYEDAQENDPSGTWDLVIEQQIHEVIKSRGTPFYLK